MPSIAPLEAPVSDCGMGLGGAEASTARRNEVWCSAFHVVGLTFGGIGEVTFGGTERSLCDELVEGHVAGC